MSLSPEMSLEQFCDEMQHRVVRHPIGSRVVREAVQFARQQKNTEFYRIAADKVHAQRQFQREMFGPTRLERILEFCSMGSLREIGITVALIVAGVSGVEVARRSFAVPPEHEAISRMDVDELADRLGLLINEKQKPAGTPQSSHTAQDKAAGDGPAEDPSGSGHLSEGDVQRIADAVIRRLQSTSTSIGNPSGSKTSQGAASDKSEKPATAEQTVSIVPGITSAISEEE
jgi:hypothetical protein